MKQALEQIKQAAIEQLENCTDLKALEELKIKYLGKKGELTAILKQMGKLSKEERPVIGQLANEVRATIEEEVKTRTEHLQQKALEEQLKKAGCEDRRSLPYHRMLLEGKLPLTIGGGIGQSRLCMLLLDRAHIGEVQAGIWPPEMRRQCMEHRIFLL